MNYHAFKEKFGAFPLFSLRDITKAEPRFDRRRLVEWQEKHYIIKVANSFYTFHKRATDENFLFLVSNKIYQPSYVSLESALTFYNFIPEGVFTTTCVSSLKTQKFSTEIGNFSYRNIKEDLFFGYRLLSEGNLHFKIAHPEKALLDYLYYNRYLNKPEEFEQLRWNKSAIIERITFKRLNIYCGQFSNKRLSIQYHSLIQFLHHA